MTDTPARTREQQLSAELPSRPEDRDLYRWVTFISAALIGVALAVLWNHEVADPIAMGMQRTVVGTTTPAELVGALALALVAGASMIVTA
jgi:hypothetical protein